MRLDPEDPDEPPVIPWFKRILNVPAHPFGDGPRAIRRRTQAVGADVLRALGTILLGALATLLLAYVTFHARVTIVFGKAIVAGGMAVLAAFRSLSSALRTLVFGSAAARPVELVIERGRLIVVEPWGTRDAYRGPAAVLESSRRGDRLQVRLRATREEGGDALVDLEAEPRVLEEALEALGARATTVRDDRPLGLPALTGPEDIPAYLAALRALDATAGEGAYRSRPRDDGFLVRVAEDPAVSIEERLGAALLLKRRGLPEPSPGDSPLLRVATETPDDDAALNEALRRALAGR